MKPSVSVCIATYNQRDFARETVVSALGQAYDALEVVVADDGSKDGTDEILSQLQVEHGERLRIIVGGPNLGVTGNCNRALRACRGEFVAFLGGDDLMLPGRIEAQLGWFARRPQGVVCGHDVEYFLSSTNASLGLFSNLSRMRAGRGPKDFLIHGNFMPGPSVMVRRAAVPSWGFDERLSTISDFKLWIDCVMDGGEFGFVPEVYTRYRRHEQSITRVRADLCHAEAFMTFALVEAEHPELAAACNWGRALLHHQQGVAALTHDDVELARVELGSALRSAPFRSSKLPVWLALAYAPATLRRAVLRKVAPNDYGATHRRAVAKG